jgi:dipeptidyl aminopeptidase/acylaminoacyl peptidase
MIHVPTALLALACTLATAETLAHSQQAQPADPVRRTEVVTLPATAGLPSGTAVGARADYEAARTDARFELLKVTYLSDDLEVVAFVYKPSQSSGRQPAIVYNRGSYVRRDAAPELLVMFHRLATAGFVVVAPMYRGSEGAPGRDEMGGADLADLMRIQAVVATLPYVDPAAVFLYGESRGGMMTLQAIRDGFRARAAAVFGAFTDLDMLLEDDAKAAAVAHQIWPDFDSGRTAIAERRSAVRWADRIGMPLLIMHGGADTAVSPRHSLRLAAALEQHGKTYELVIVAGARHVLAPFEAERDARAVAWFQRHLPR